MTIVYQARRHYKYQLAQACELPCAVYPEQEIQTRFIRLSVNGNLWLAPYYAWDGASGPMPDFNSIMRASLVHDALYQLMREGHLDLAKYRPAADQALLRYCLEDGMNPLLARWVYFCVRRFGAKYARSGLRQLPVAHNTTPSIALESNK